MSINRRAFIAATICSPFAVGCQNDSNQPSPMPAPEPTFVPDRILFPGNPWPKGHAIIEFEWTAEILTDETVMGHLHLKSEDYYAHDEDPFNYDDLPEDDPTPDWQSKVVWNNFHACILSSTYWGHDGFRMASPDDKFNAAELDGKSFNVDPLPFDIEDDEPSIGIYCQGHDTVAAHDISFVSTGKSYTIDWSAQIASSYYGSFEFNHWLFARKTDVRFSGIAIAASVPAKDARRLFRACVANPDAYKEEETEYQRVFRISG